jgi:hypothetical protein
MRLSRAAAASSFDRTGLERVPWSAFGAGIARDGHEGQTLEKALLDRPRAPSFDTSAATTARTWVPPVRRRLGWLVLAAVATAAGGGCSGANGGSGFGSGGGGTGTPTTSGSSSGTTGSSSGPGASGGSTGGGFTTSSSSGGSSGGGSVCPYMDSTDHDGDGFAFTDGDCNDCDPNSNPGAYDVPGDMIDEDCNGVADDEPTGCDTMAVLDSADAFHAALAMDVCRKTTEDATGHQRTWGVTQATYTAPDGSDNCTDTNSGSQGSCAANTSFALGHGNLTQLGVNAPKQGSHMAAISSGTARDPKDPGYQDVAGFDKSYTTGSPAPYPKDTPACPGVITGQPHDGIALTFTIRVPTNATAFQFETNFLTYEFPEFICSKYNDSFVVMMTPKIASLPDGNIAFDSAGNPISVNNSLLQVCDPQKAGKKNFACPLGSSSLKGTGFGKDTAIILGQNHAATGWLTTKAPIDPSLKGKDMTLSFTVWDSSDGILDSTELIDNFTWSTDPGDAQIPPKTTPTPQ